METKQNRPLLIVEDNDEDFEALNKMMQEAAIANPVYRCLDGEEALAFLYHRGKYKNIILAPRPSLIILALNLPGKEGRDILTHLKRDDNFKAIPVVILTTSSNPKDVEACYLQGVNGYIVKPLDTQRLEQIVQVFLNYWFKAVELPYSNR